MELLDRPAASAAGAVRAALIELTRVVDVLQSGSLDGLDDHEVLAVFRIWRRSGGGCRRWITG